MLLSRKVCCGARKSGWKSGGSYDYFSIAWSLSVEEWFYVTFPLALLMASPFLPKDNRGLIIIAGSFVIGCSLARLTFPADHWGADVRRVVAFRLDSIAWGVLLRIAAIQLRPLISAYIVMASAAFAAFALYGAGQQIVLAEFGFPFAAAAFGAASVTLAISAEGFIANRPLALFTAKWAGRISYSAYLFHLIVAELTLPLIADFRFAWKLPIIMVVLVGFCVLTYWLFERPTLAARPSYKKRQA